jgi:hypothetical protein
VELRYFYGLSMETWRSGVSQPQALNLKDLEPGTNIELSLRQFERRLCERWCGQGGGNRLAQEFGEQRAESRQSCRLRARKRLARKPNWRMRTRPEGSMWSKKRRTNSTASKVMILRWPLDVEEGVDPTLTTP